MSRPRPTTDDDLMDLGSRVSYTPPERMPPQVEVNGVEFEVVHSVQDPVTGLDAYAFQNISTGELTVGFQGTADLTDVLVDAQLVTSLTPQQFQAAEDYVHAVEAELGRPVRSVCGNSLGGGLAAYVAGKNPRIRAVTVNPAPVPQELAGLDAPHIRNYVTTTDVLHRAVVAGGLGHRVIGDVIEVPGTSFHLTYLAANHVGSDRDDGPYDASMAVPFSLFHPGTVIGRGGYGAKVDIDLDALTAMSTGLRRQRDDLLTVLDTELVELQRELREYGGRLDARSDAARHVVAELAEDVYGPLRRGLLEVTDDIVHWLISVEVEVPYLSGPGGTRPLAGLGGLLARARNLAVRGADIAVGAAAEAAWRTYEVAFLDESRVLTGVLTRQARSVRTDLGLVDRKWVVLARSTRLAALAVLRADEAAAAAIASRSCAPDAVDVDLPSWPDGQVERLPEELLKQVAQTAVDARQLAVGELVTQLARSLAAEVGEGLALVCSAVVALLETIEGVLSSAARTARTAVGLLTAGPAGALSGALGVDDDLARFRDTVDELERGFRARSDEWQDHLAHVVRALDRAPYAVEDLRVYLDSTFFSDAMIEEVYDGLLKCRNLVDRSATSFGEVAHQLADHEARLIDALAGNATDVRRDLVTTGSSLTTMVR